MSLVMTGLAHGVRIAQCRGARLEIRTTEPSTDGEPGVAYMQLDGEPWKQRIPSRKGDPPLQVSCLVPLNSPVVASQLSAKVICKVKVVLTMCDISNLSERCCVV